MKSDENLVHTITRNMVPIKLAIRSFKAYAIQLNKNMKKKEKKRQNTVISLHVFLLTENFFLTRV